MRFRHTISARRSAVLGVLPRRARALLYRHCARRRAARRRAADVRSFGERPTSGARRRRRCRKRPNNRVLRGGAQRARTITPGVGRHGGCGASNGRRLAARRWPASRAAANGPTLVAAATAACRERPKNRVLRGGTQRARTITPDVGRRGGCGAAAKGQRRAARRWPASRAAANGPTLVAAATAALLRTAEKLGPPRRRAARAHLHTPTSGGAAGAALPRSANVGRRGAGRRYALRRTARRWSPRRLRRSRERPKNRVLRCGVQRARTITPDVRRRGGCGAAAKGQRRVAGRWPASRAAANGPTLVAAATAALPRTAEKPRPPLRRAARAHHHIRRRAARRVRRCRERPTSGGAALAGVTRCGERPDVGRRGDCGAAANGRKTASSEAARSARAIAPDVGQRGEYGAAANGRRHVGRRGDCGAAANGRKPASSEAACSARAPSHPTSGGAAGAAPPRTADVRRRGAAANGRRRGAR
jgi:hypothetical protein